MLAYLLVAKPADMGANLIRLAWANVCSRVLPCAAATLILFFGRLRRIRPNPRFFEKTAAFEVLKLGNAFFILQVLNLLNFATNEILISALFSPEYVVEYQIYSRLFALVNIFFMLALTPFWSAITKEMARGNFSWLRKVHKFLLLFALLGICCEFAIIPFLQYITDIWLGNKVIEINIGYALILALFNGIMIWASAHGTITYGMNIIKLQMITFGIALACKFPLTLFLMNIFENWSVVAAANCIILIPNAVIVPIYVKNYIQRVHSA
jgi:O-antigen/teichoic acid export membrane protein